MKKAGKKGTYYEAFSDIRNLPANPKCCSDFRLSIRGTLPAVPRKNFFDLMLMSVYIGAPSPADFFPCGCSGTQVPAILWVLLPLCPWGRSLHSATSLGKTKGDAQGSYGPSLEVDLSLLFRSVGPVPLSLKFTSVCLLLT
jgi:hypothetical protein